MNDMRDDLREHRVEPAADLVTDLDPRVHPNTLARGPAKRFEEWITWGNPSLRAQMRVQIWPPLAPSSVREA